MAATGLLRRLAREYVVVLVLAMLVVIPTLGPFTHGDTGRALRNGLLQGIGALLLVLLAARISPRREQLAYVARSGVNLPLALFLFWAALGLFRAPDRVFAMGEWLRLLTGAVVYYALALFLDNRVQLGLLIDSVMGLVILLVGYGLFAQGAEIGHRGLSSVFPNPHHLSAVLCVLLPLLAGVALGAEERRRRAIGITAAIVAAAGLLFTLERSAWIASAAGLVATLCLAGSPAGSAARRTARRSAAVVVATAALALVGFFATTGVYAVVAERARDVSTAVQGRDPSLIWRARKWRGTARMVAERPLLGWGTGQYVLYQAPYTGIGMAREDVRRYGASFDEMAYNEYLQTAAELGLPGLFLYLLVLASFFSKAFRALPRLPPGFRRTCLIGSVGGVVAQIVDAAANGSWRYAECSIFFWLMLGIGVAVIRMASQMPAGGRREPALIAGSRRRAAEGG